MKRRARGIGIVLGLLGVALAAAALAAPIPQDPGHHRMADGRTFLGTLDHLTAAAAVFVVVWMLLARRPYPQLDREAP